PDRLPNALVAADALRDRFPGGIHLLREESKWWKNAKWQEFVSEFAEVHPFPKVRTCRGLKDLQRLYRQNVDRQRGVGALPINPGGDGVRLRRLQKDPDEIFDAIIFMSNSGGELPTRAEDQIIPSRFPSIAELRDFSSHINHAQNRQGRVIFFGTPFLLVKNL